MSIDNPISRLVFKLRESEISEFPGIIKAANLKDSDLQAFATWEGQDYTRNCIERNDDFELLLLCWNPGDKTPIHGHGGQKCWVYQISGEIEERRFVNTEDGPVLQYKHKLEEGQLTYMDDKMGFHVLSNPGEHRSMSMHIYVKPIDRCRVYNPEESCFEEKKLSYDQIISEIA